jgi:cytochrome c55X
MTMKGGLGAPLLPGTLEGKPDDALVAIILDGLADTPMPGWRPLLSEAEASWMVQRLKRGLE